MRLFLTLLLCTTGLTPYAQKKHSCEQLEKFLNYPEVLSAFDLDEKNDTATIIDLDNNFARYCKDIRWKNKAAAVIHDRALTKEIRGMDPYGKYKGNCSVFLISSYSRKGQVHSFEILRPCNSIQVIGKIRVVDGKAELIAVKHYVL